MALKPFVGETEKTPQFNHNMYLITSFYCKEDP